jgi:hypothetical protein
MFKRGDRVIYTKKAKSSIYPHDCTGEEGTVIKEYNVFYNTRYSPYFGIEWDNPWKFGDFIATSYKNLEKIHTKPDWIV